MRYFKFTFSLFFIVNLVFSQNIKDPLLSEDSNAQQKWVDSTYNTLTLKEKVGQLYTVQVFSNQDRPSKKAIIQLIKDYQIGGVIYSNGGPVRQARLDNELQSFSKIPMLVSMDESVVSATAARGGLSI